MKSFVINMPLLFDDEKCRERERKRERLKRIMQKLLIGEAVEITSKLRQ